MFSNLTNKVPDNYILSSLSKKAKILCDFRIAEIEEDLEEFARLHQAETKDVYPKM